MAQPPPQTHTPTMSIQDLCHHQENITMESTLFLEFMQVKTLHKISRARAGDGRLTSFITKPQNSEILTTSLSAKISSPMQTCGGSIETHNIVVQHRL